MPAILTVVAAPAHASSCPLSVIITTTGLSANGFDLYIRDSKNLNSNTNTDPLSNITTTGTTNPVVNMSMLVTDCAGNPVSGATVVVSSDHQRDLEGATGGELLGFTPATQTSGFGEAPGNRIATVTSDAAGLAKVKICTATYSSADIGTTPRSGTWTITLSAPGFGQSTRTLTYRVFDGQPTV
ncbi:MAG: hypothetical protein IPM08_00530 [Actinomycetales bacterium]|nr:hypothetical protein [Actinomycetales bacterium]